MIPKHIILVLCCMLLIPLASAQSLTYTAPEGQALWAVDLDIPHGTTGTIDFYQENGDTVTAEFDYTGLPLATFTASVGDSEEISSTLPPFVPMKMSVWNGDNTTYSRQLKLGYGLIYPAWTNVAQTTIDRSYITGYYLDADNTVSISEELMSIEDANERLAYTPDTSILDLLYEYFNIFLSVFIGLVYWIKFLFVDNLILTVTLYLAVSMAYCANSSRDIFTFYKKFLRLQRTVFEFIMNAASVTMSIVAQIGGLVVAGVSTVLSKFAGLLGFI